MKEDSRTKVSPPPVFENLLQTGELQAGFVDLMFLKGLRADDFGQKPAKRGNGSDPRRGKDLALFSVYFICKYTRSREFVKPHFCRPGQGVASVGEEECQIGNRPGQPREGYRMLAGEIAGGAI